MKKQDTTILFKIDSDLKKAFKSKCDENQQTVSGRLKFLMKLDSENKVILK